MDIAEILRNAPKGTKLYSPLFGNVIFQDVDSDEDYPINVKTDKDSYWRFSHEGKFYCCFEDTECLLFPSKENRDWSTFKVEQEFSTTLADCGTTLGFNRLSDEQDYCKKKLNALRKVLIYRDSWWNIDNNWKPNWSNAVEEKSTIALISNKICTCENYRTHCILAFRTPEIRDKFLETFRDLIEECKELL